MTALTPFTGQEDFGSFRLEHTPNGHVVTPKFTLRMEPDERYGYGSRYHRYIFASKTAFAELLKIDRDDIIVTEYRSQDAATELWWRLGTKKPCALPAPPTAPKPALRDEMRGAIEI